MTIGQRIKMAREAAQLSQDELGAACGTKRQTIFKYESGLITNIPSDRLEKIAKVLNVTPAYLMGWEEQPESSSGTWIPVLGKVAAGIPIDAIENIEDYEEVPKQMSPQDYFALRIKGDSMEPRVKDGDVVIVKKQSYAETGDVAVVLVNGDSATVKKIKKGPDGVMLIPINTAYEPMYYSNSDIERLPVTILGKVVELRGKI